MSDLIFPRTRPPVTSVHGRIGAVVAANNDYAAAQITFTPAGTIASVTVQAAIEELSAEAAAGYQPLDATLTNLAAQDWVANALPIGSGVNTVAQVSFAANTFPARASSGNLVAKTITDFGLSLIDDADAAAARTTLGIGTGGTLITDTDGTLAANSDARVATQKAVKTYVDAHVGLGLEQIEDSLATAFVPGYSTEIEYDDAAGQFTWHHAERIKIDGDAATITFDLADSVGAHHDTDPITQDVTLAVTNEGLGASGDPGKLFRIKLNYDDVGGHTVTFWSGITWCNGYPPATTPVGGSGDTFQFLVTDCGGYETTYLGWILSTERGVMASGTATPPATASIVTTTPGVSGIQNKVDDYWKFNETGTGTRFAAIGSNNIGSADGSASGMIGNAASYNGSGTGGAKSNPTGAIASVNHDFTLFGWFNVANVAASSGYIFNLTDSGGAVVLQVYVVGSNVRGSLLTSYGGGDTAVVIATTFGTLANSTWYFVALRWNQTTHVLSISVNAGTPNTTTAAAGAVTAAIQTLTFGYIPGSTLLVDEWGFCGELLSDAELTQIYNSGSGSTSPFSSDVNEKQTLTFTGTPTNGSVLLTVLTHDVTIPFNASHAAAQTLIQAAIGSGNCAVTGGDLPGSPLVIEFTGIYAGLNVADSSVDDSEIDGHCNLDWSICEGDTVTVSGSGVHTIRHVNPIPLKTLRVAVSNSGASGSLLFTAAGGAVLDWGAAGAPAMPADGQTIWLEFTCKTVTDIKGKLWFDRPCSVVLFDHFADVSTTHTDGTADDLYSDTIPAGRLSANGDKIVATEYTNLVASATAARRLKKYFAGSLIWDSGALTLTLGGDFTINTLIIRESSTVVRCLVTVTSTSASTVPYVTETRITGLTLSNTQILKTTGTASGTGAASGDIVEKLATVEFKPAA